MLICEYTGLLKIYRQPQMYQTLIPSLKKLSDIQSIQMSLKTSKRLGLTLFSWHCVDFQDHAGAFLWFGIEPNFGGKNSIN